MVSEDLALVTARSGLPSVKVGGTPYHSLYDPVREAQKFCAPLGIEQADVIFLFGWGLGYCGSALRPRLKLGARVFVFEPNRALFELYGSQTQNRQTFEDSRFEFVAGDSIIRF